MPSPILCFSHLRWDFVYQRPNHLMSRAGRDRQVFYVEEPTMGAAVPALDFAQRGDVSVVTPRLPAGLDQEQQEAALRGLIDHLIVTQELGEPTLWYYTPMAYRWTEHLRAGVVVYDCMDELSSFAGAPAALRVREQALLARADVVFTGGHALHEAKRSRHANVHCFPSSVDRGHFEGARAEGPEPVDQAPIPRPRLGYFGVIDERMDLALIEAVAALRPEWHIILVGPVCKIDPATVPDRPNVHQLGLKRYEELPAYLGGWDVAILPFARNEATRFISPTKTPEYLAGGRAVVSTSITDVVEPYGRLGLAYIADDPAAFVEAAQRAMDEDADTRLARTDSFLRGASWDVTWAAMDELLDAATARRSDPVGAPRSVNTSVPAARAGLLAHARDALPVGAQMGWRE